MTDADTNDTSPPDTHLYAPDGDPWCHFTKGLHCTNGDRCRNPNHRPDPRSTR